MTGLLPRSRLRRWIGLIVALSWAAWGTEAFPQEGVQETRFASIQYQNPGQLEELARKIQPSALTLSLNQILLGPGKSQTEARAGRYVDQLFQRVQVILEMPKPDLRVKIKIYRNQDELSEAFAGITGRSTQSPAFYWRETNTIYVHLEKISTGILAHEMAHAVIGHYFIVSPPEKIAELLCQYVDKEVSRGNF
ncbi:MAG: hypothetical protein AB1512_14385 [Thermodesulfobacteriota bacterium]